MLAARDFFQIFEAPLGPAVARQAGVSALVNMSQMTVSEMSIQNTTPSHQQRQYWLSEQALAWSGLPVVGRIVRDRGRIELPFGRGKTSPVAAADVAQVTNYSELRSTIFNSNNTA
jgi:uncharacterized protein YbjT (DUF2867 family)